MVASKGLKSRVTLDNTTCRRTALVGVPRNFKVFSEDDKVIISGCDFPESKRKFVPVGKAIGQVNPRDSKMKPLEKLDKSNGKNDTSYTGRKALVDISNFRRNSSSTETRDGSKPGKGKSERAVSQRASIGPGTSAASSSSSRKPVMGKMRMSRIQVTGDCHNLESVMAKDAKAFAGGMRLKVQGQKIVNSVGRKSTRNVLAPTRKSLPVLKKVNEVETTTSGLRKGNADHAEKGKGKFVFPVKPKIGGKVVAQVSNAPRNLSKNRVSDGFNKMASGGQSNGDARASLNAFAKPTVNTTSKTLRASKSKLTSVLNESGLRASISSKRTEESAVSALSKKIASVLPCEQPDREDLTSDSNNNYETTSHIINRGYDRRKSYTSLLIARSKLMKEHGKVTKQDFLPNIDDDCNQLEVAEYVDEIYQYYWVMETQNHSLKNYMEIQTDITPQMRGILINWLIEVHTKFDLMQETLYLMVTLLDLYLSLVCIKKNELQLVGLTALLLASKYEDFWHPKVMELISISAEWYTRDQMLQMETAILKRLKFRLNTPTPYVFMLRFLKAAQSDTKFRNLAFYLIELCLVEYEALNFKPSLLCASAIYVTRRTLQMTPAWTPLLGKHARYEEYQLRDCAEMILRFHKAAQTGVLNVTYEKYMSTDKSRVAAIEPLNMLSLMQASI